MSKHTRGPWKYKETNGGEYGLCTIYSEIDNRGVARHVAIENASLIAAAPELYDAGGEMAEAVALLPADDGRILGLLPILCRLRAAIAKAEGN